MFFSFIPKVSGLSGYSPKLAGIGLTVTILGLAAPGLVELLSRTNGTLALVVVGLMAFLIGVFTLFAYFLPSFIAFREQKKNKVKILVLNFFAIMPLLGMIAYIWACIPEKPDNASIHELQ